MVSDCLQQLNKLQTFKPYCAWPCAEHRKWSSLTKHESFIAWYCCALADRVAIVLLNWMSLAEWSCDLLDEFEIVKYKTDYVNCTLECIVIGTVSLCQCWIYQSFAGGQSHTFPPSPQPVLSSPPAFFPPQVTSLSGIQDRAPATEAFLSIFSSSDCLRGWSQHLAFAKHSDNITTETFTGSRGGWFTALSLLFKFWWCQPPSNWQFQPCHIVHWQPQSVRVWRRSIICEMCPVNRLKIVMLRSTFFSVWCVTKIIWGKASLLGALWRKFVWFEEAGICGTAGIESRLFVVLLDRRLTLSSTVMPNGYALKRSRPYWRIP